MHTYGGLDAPSALLLSNAVAPAAIKPHARTMRLLGSPDSQNKYSQSLFFFAQNHTVEAPEGFHCARVYVPTAKGSLHTYICISTFENFEIAKRGLLYAEEVE